MANKLFLNGAGGRIFICILRALYKEKQLGSVVGFGASGPKDLRILAERLEHDSTHGRYPLEVGYTTESKFGPEHIGYITFEGEGEAYKIPIFGQPDPSKLPLTELGADVAIDATGKFLTRELAEGFLKAGAKKVLMSAPAKDDTPLIIYDINGEKDNGLDVVSLASCTTNCAAPIVFALAETFSYPQAIFLNTTHAVTNSQKILDGSSGKIANGFSGLNNIIVSDTGATRSLQKMFPAIKDTNGISCRVPVADGSICDLVMTFDPEDGNTAKINNESVLAALQDYSANKYPNLLKISKRESMISTYVLGDSHTSVVAPPQIFCSGNTVRVIAGYDNEYAYSYQLTVSALKAPLPK
ncbi:MAG: hypothetical protein LBK04_00780 [Clostridiales Family XIII bacterium]|nr:hypothetical protein [Clostridiales Family XIII bacterium]